MDPTITINDETDATTFKVEDKTANKAGYKTNIAAEGAEVTENTVFTFTVTPEEYYEIKSVSAKIDTAETASELNPESTAADGTQTYKVTVTGNVEITIAASKIMYAVTVDCDEDAVTHTLEEEIEAGKDLVFTAAANTGSRIEEVSYRIGTGAKTTLEPTGDAKTTYTIEKDKITGNVQITIKSVNTYTVTFSKENENVTAITDIMIDGKKADTDKLDETINDDWKVSVDDGQKISFKVSTKEPFRVAEEDGITIKYETQRAAQNVAVSNGVYSFTVRKNATLEIATELDPAKCGAFTVTVNGGKATATIKMPDDATDKDNINGTLVEFGTKYATRNEKVVLAIAPVDGYVLDSEKGVKIDGSETRATKDADESGNTPAEWTIDLLTADGKVKDVKVEITTTPAPTENDTKIKVVIDEEAKNLSGLTVKANGTGAALTTDSEGVYTVPGGSETVTIAVTAENGYEPKTDSKLVEGPAVATVSGKKTYTYTILASKLKERNPDTVTFTEKAVTYSIICEDENGVAELSASMNDEEIEDLENIPEGATVAVRVEEANESIPLKSVTYTVGTTSKTVKVAKGAAAFTVKMTGDVTITVDADAPYAAAQLQDAETNKPVEPVKGVYNVSYEGTYKVGLTQGGDPVEEIADVKVFVGKNELKEGVKITGKGSGAPTLQMSQDVANTKLTVKLYVEDAYGDYVDTKADYTLQVAKVVSKITAPSTAKQATDTTKKYKVTTDGGEFAKLTVSVANANPATANAVIKGVPTYDAKAGELTIVTGQTPGTADVVITDGKVTSTIKVTTTALIDKKTTKPTVALKNATDVKLTLTVGSKNADFANIANGAVWYKVEAEPKGDINKDKLEDTVETQYVKRTKDSDEVEIQVGKSTTLGSGAAGEYNVKVSLVHVTDKDLTSADVANNIVTFGENEKAESTPQEKAFKTLTPAWESNLKLKKGQATLTTGEGPVTIAIPQFSKTTTYKEIKADNVTDLTYADSTGGLELDVNGNGEIVAKATVGETAVGKHTIQVIAAANPKSASGGEEGKDDVEEESLTEEYTMYASRATIVVTVVQGIDSLEVQLPSQSIYKPTGKAATLKPTLKFNDGTKATQPKVKNVKWELVDTNGDKLSSNSKVSINAKNGTVTVAKDYVLKKGENANTFKIKVSADNAPKKFAGVAGTIEDSEIYSKEITITNKGAEVKTVAIVKEKTTAGSGPDEGVETEGINVQETGTVEYEVIAVPTKDEKTDKVVAASVDATILNDAQVAVFNTLDVEQGKTYSADKVLNNLDLTIKSSKKDIVVERDGSLKVNKPAKGVKLTATANDGSKNKAELLLNVDYDSITDTDLALKISKAEDSATALIDPKTPTGNDKEYAGAATNTFVATLMEKAKSAADSTYAPATAFKNYDVKVTDGTKVAQSGNTVKFTTAKETVTIELKDAATKATLKTYKLTNTHFVDSKGTKIKSVKVTGSLKQTGMNSEQDITVKVEAPSVEALVGEDGLKAGVKAQIDLDWSKMNAKNADDFMTFRSNLAKVEYDITSFAPGKNNATWTGEFALEFKEDAEDGAKAFKDTKLSSYPLKVTLLGDVTTGEGDDEETVTKALTQAAATTVKVEKTKKFTFKPATSYTIGSKDGYAVLSGKSSIPRGELDLEFVGLLNMADKNGQENHFTDAFKVENGKLMVKGASEAADKANLTGYVEYEATTNMTCYDTQTQSGVIKITVKIKDNASSLKYTHDPATIGFKKDAEATVTVKVNSKDALVAGTVEVVAAKVKTTKDSLEVKEVKDGTLVLKLSEPVDFAKKKKISADVYIVTSDNANKADFAEGKDGDWNKYAAVVKVTLTVDSKLKIDETLTKAIGDAVKAVVNAEGENKVVITTATKWNEEIETAILKAANEASGVSPDFEVVAATKPLEVDVDNKKATISLIVQQVGLTTNFETITIEVSDLTTPTEDGGGNQEG